MKYLLYLALDAAPQSFHAGDRNWRWCRSGIRIKW